MLDQKAMKTIKAENAMVAWNPRWLNDGSDRELGDARVGTHPDNGKLKDLALWFAPKHCPPQAPYKEEQVRHAYMMLGLMLNAWSMVCRDGLNPKDVHDALSGIEDYLAILPDDFSTEGLKHILSQNQLLP